MRRWHLSYVLIAALALTACGGGASPTATSAVDATPNLQSEVDVTVVATSAVPTTQPQTGTTLPVSTLILSQLNTLLAQTPTGRVLTLSEDRFVGRGSPNGRYGLRFDQAGNKFDLALVDYATTPETVKPIPDGNGLSGPSVLWKVDSSGFAFVDFPAVGQQPKARTIFYYDLASGETKRLIPELQDARKVAFPVGFAPNGDYLLYAVGDADAEGFGGPGSQPTLLDLTKNQSTNLPPDSLRGFSQWLRDSSGFLVLRSDLTAPSGVYRYNLSDLSNPQRLTPQNAADLLIDVSPDGKRIAVTSVQDGDIANVYMMNLDGSSRRRLTNFTETEQTITALVWGNDGIYYSLVGDDNQATTWRMDLDGTNVTQVAQGTLYTIVGAG